jgi:SNF2 family DNA or RNA helicase
MVEAGLRRASISMLRFDGKVPQAERQSVVNKFQDPGDSSVQVLLLTLSCGAVG